MTQEEKAKAYDEALKVLHKYDGAHIMFTQDLKEEMFPELKESEDERISKEIIYFLSRNTLQFGEDIDKYKSWIAWLEKQGEQNLIMAKSPQLGERKPVDNGESNLLTVERAKEMSPFMRSGFENESNDKVEPKFKVGDWIVTNKNHIWYVDETPETTLYLYRLINQNGKVEVAEFEVVDKKARLWTINDANDGDVLVCIGKYGQEIGIIKEYVGKYGGCDKCFKAYCFVDWDGIFRTSEYMGSKEIHPATNEQRDTLEKAMADAGYTFDFEKKELKKIEQNSVWSEEDEGLLNNIEESLLAYKIIVMDNDTKLANYIEKEINFLKLLKDRYTWKPSDEQINALAKNVEYVNVGYTQSILKALLEDLKKLMEE